MEYDALEKLLGSFASLCNAYQVPPDNPGSGTPQEPDEGAMRLNEMIPELTDRSLDQRQRNLIERTCRRILRNNPGKPAVGVAIAFIIGLNTPADKPLRFRRRMPRGARRLCLA